MNTDVIIANFLGLALSKCFTYVNSSKPSSNQQNHAEVDVFIGSVFQMGKLRHRRLHNFLQGDRAGKQHSNDLNPGSSASESGLIHSIIFLSRERGPRGGRDTEHLF